MKKLFLAVCLFIFLLLLYLFYDSLNAEVRLNEIVSCNHTVAYDNTGTFHDYIELYNSSAHPIDISGYHLSDSKKKLDRFTFPEKTIVAPGEYYMVWADTKPMTVLVDNNYLYTNFSLKKGEKVYFSNKDGQIIDKIKVPKDLECNMSYSRIPHISKWAKREPTPGKQNKLYGKRKIRVIPDVEVQFNTPSGFYDEPFELKMTVPKGFDIYYTLDSTKPTQKSIRYTKPVKIYDASKNPNKYSAITSTSSISSYVPNYPIDKATIVRAIAVRRWDGAISKITEASYFIGFQNKPGYKGIPILSIITDPENLFDYEKGIYVTGKIQDMIKNSAKELGCYQTTTNYSAEGKDWAREIYIDYITDKTVTHFSGKIKIQGKCARFKLQKNFSLSDLRKNGSEEKSPLEFNLRAISDVYRIEEMLVYTLTSNRSEILSNPPEDTVILFLDGEFWGIYSIYKKITPNFILEKTQLKNSELIDLQRSAKMYGQTDFNPKYKTYEEIERNVNLDGLIAYLSINAYIANLDACNLEWWNVVRWRSSENPIFNKWQWMVHDLDCEVLPVLHNPFKKNEICNLIVGNKFLETLFSFDQFKKKFITTFQDIANYNFNSQRVNQSLDEIEDKYGNALVLTCRRFKSSSFSQKSLNMEVKILRNFFNHRFKYIMPYMKEYFHLTGELTKIHKLSGKINGGRVLLNTIELAADEEYIGEYYSDYPLSLDVKTFPGYLFQGWLIDDKLVKTKKMDLDISKPRKIEAVWIKEKNDSERIKP